MSRFGKLRQGGALRCADDEQSGPQLGDPEVSGIDDCPPAVVTSLVDLG
jgi:hypothetical protein